MGYNARMGKFSGVKIMLLLGRQLLVYQRDNKPGLRFAGLWDLPGGGREGDETPIECVIREVYEEFGLLLPPDSILYQKEYPAMHDPTQRAYFMVAPINQTQIDSIVFGPEGQRWKLMTVSEYLRSSETVEPLKDRIRAYLKQ